MAVPVLSVSTSTAVEPPLKLAPAALTSTVNSTPMLAAGQLLAPIASVTWTSRGVVKAVPTLALWGVPATSVSTKLGAPVPVHCWAAWAAARAGGAESTAPPVPRASGAPTRTRTGRARPNLRAA